MAERRGGGLTRYAIQCDGDGNVEASEFDVRLFREKLKLRQCRYKTHNKHQKHQAVHPPPGSEKRHVVVSSRTDRGIIKVEVGIFQPKTPRRMPLSLFSDK